METSTSTSSANLGPCIPAALRLREQVGPLLGARWHMQCQALVRGTAPGDGMQQGHVPCGGPSNGLAH